MYDITYTSYTTNIVTVDKKSILYYCKNKYDLYKVTDFQGNKYNQNSEEWDRIKLYLNKLAVKDAKRLLS